ncbi:hypothetical protein Tco_1047394, partial [Tanacetum coccineum]
MDREQWEAEVVEEASGSEDVLKEVKLEWLK